MMKISKRTREQAALICAIAASGPYTMTDTITEVAGHGADLDVGAARLADEAYAHALHTMPRDFPFDSFVFSQEVRAEAEALLRCGWSP